MSLLSSFTEMRNRWCQHWDYRSARAAREGWHTKMPDGCREMDEVEEYMREREGEGERETEKRD